MANVLAVTEQRGGALRKTSHEVVWAARQLADAMGAQVDALVLGAPGVDAGAARLGEVGADRVLVAESAAFGKYAPDGYAATAAAAVKAGGYGAEHILRSGTVRPDQAIKGGLRAVGRRRRDRRARKRTRRVAVLRLRRRRG